MRAALLACLLLAPALVAGCAGDQPPANQTDDDQGPDYVLAPEERPTAIVETNRGTFELELYGDMTPQTVQNFGQLAQDGFYDQVKFHRVIDGFMIQGGDPETIGNNDTDRWGSGGPGYSIVDEFPCKDGTLSEEHPGSYRAPANQCQGHGGFQATHHKAGILSMANSGPRSGGSQFFLTLTATPHLDGYHTVFGEVIDGMDVVEAIGGTETRCTQEGHEPSSRTCSQNRWNYPVDPVIIESVTIEGELPGVELRTFSR